MLIGQLAIVVRVGYNPNYTGGQQCPLYFCSLFLFEKGVFG